MSRAPLAPPRAEDQPPSHTANRQKCWVLLSTWGVGASILSLIKLTWLVCDEGRVTRLCWLSRAAGLLKKRLKGKVLVTQSCPTLCDPVDGSPRGSSVHGILQARELERVTMSSSRGSSRPRA